MVTPRGIGTPAPKRPRRAPNWERLGPSRWQSAMVFCAAVVACGVFFEVMLWVASH
jgi:hypothetical protein